MKKIILVLAMAVAITACKKEEKKEFTATDVTGTTQVKGNVSKTVITPNGTGGWTSTTRVPAPNVNVAVTVNRNSLYPNSNAQGADVYNATTDANGNYNLTVKSNATGVQAKITIDGFTGTQDTLINGQLKAGLYSTFAGKNVTANLVMGQNFTVDHNFSANNAVNNPNQIVIGNAVVSGSIGIEKVQQVIIGANPPFYTATVVPQANHKVFLRLDKDPSTLADKVYEVMTDANGYYKFNVNTVSPGELGFPQVADIWVEDYAASRDTIMVDKSIKTGPTGVYLKKTKQTTGVYSNSIKNANHMQYTTFIAD